ncbi:MAG: hypothetical protein R3236_06785 [Phycisphaeraceae bacterium]|nr:hypothetical protein [Phycisphaeraceae bacterium]
MFRTSSILGCLITAMAIGTLWAQDRSSGPTAPETLKKKKAAAKTAGKTADSKPKKRPEPSVAQKSTASNNQKGSTGATEKKAEAQPNKPAEAQDKKPETSDASRDPFAPSSKIRRQALRESGAVFTPTNVREGLPKLTMRGLAKSGKEIVALLDIEGVGVFVVRVDDKVTLQTKGLNTVLRIKELQNNSLLVEVGHINQTIIVR